MSRYFSTVLDVRPSNEANSLISLFQNYRLFFGLYSKIIATYWEYSLGLIESSINSAEILTSSGPERLQKQPDCRNQYDGGDYQADYRINDVQAGP